MTPQEAIQLLDSAVAGLEGTRSQHVQLQTAIQTLNVLVVAEETKAKRKAIVEAEKK